MMEAEPYHIFLQLNKRITNPQVPHDEDDAAMDELLALAHEFLQHFCHGNQQNQAILHKHLDLFLNVGVSIKEINYQIKIIVLCSTEFIKSDQDTTYTV